MISSRLNRTRDGNGFSLNKMVCLSLFIHIVALSLIIFSPTVPSPKWTFGPVYSVQLVNLQDTSFRGNTASSLSKEILTPSPAPGAIVLKRPVETISSVPVRQVDVQKKKNPQREKAVEAVKSVGFSTEPAIHAVDRLMISDMKLSTHTTVALPEERSIGRTSEDCVKAGLD